MRQTFVSLGFPVQSHRSFFLAGDLSQCKQILFADLQTPAFHLFPKILFLENPKLNVIFAFFPILLLAMVSFFMGAAISWVAGIFSFLFLCFFVFFGFSNPINYNQSTGLIACYLLATQLPPKTAFVFLDNSFFQRGTRKFFHFYGNEAMKIRRIFIGPVGMGNQILAKGAFPLSTQQQIGNSPLRFLSQENCRPYDCILQCGFSGKYGATVSGIGSAKDQLLNAGLLNQVVAFLQANL